LVAVEGEPLQGDHADRVADLAVLEHRARLGKRQDLDEDVLAFGLEAENAAGMAAAFVAMNDTFGPLYLVSRAEAATPEMADARAAAHFLAAELGTDDVLLVKGSRGNRLEVVLENFRSDRIAIRNGETIPGFVPGAESTCSS